MTTKINTNGPFLPMQAAPQLFTYDYKRILSEVCTPLAGVTSNEIVGIVVNAEVTPLGIVTEKVSSIVRAQKDSKDGTPFEMQPFEAQPEEVRRDLSFACMSALTDSLFDKEEAYRIYETMVPVLSGTTQLSITLLPEAAFIADAALSMKIFSLADRSKIQETLDHSLKAVLPRVPETAHEAISSLKAYKPILRFANSFWSVSGPKFGADHTKLQLKLWS
jgi:hypothetical protein